MSRKRRRRKRQPAAGSRTAGAVPDAPAPASERPDRDSRAVPRQEERARSREPQPADEERRPRGLFPGATAPSPFPPFGVSLARGFRLVGTSPLLLGASFLSTLATWGTLVALGGAVPFPYLLAAMSASPLHIFFFDIDLILRLGGTSASALLGTAALGAIRAVTFAILLLLIGAALRGPIELRAALRPLPKVVLSLFGIYVAEVAAVIAAQLVAGLLQGTLRVVLALLALHFLSFVPVVIALERTSARPGLLLGFRAARLPAGRHLAFVVAYFIATLYLLLLTPPLAPATPSLLAWAFVLGVTFVHVGVSAALAYRWLAVRDHPAVVVAPGPPGGTNAGAATRRRSG